MPFTLPTIYALRSVSVKNINQRIKFIENLYKFKGSTILLTLGYNLESSNYTNSYSSIDNEISYNINYFL